MPAANLFHSGDASLYDVPTRASGPAGALPLTPEMLRERPSGDLFGWSQNAGMGWSAARLGGREFLLLSTQGGVRAPDGTPIALGYHTGHWEVGLLVEGAARELTAAGAIPFAAACSDPCDGRSQGTAGMYDSLAYRNDAAQVLGRLIRSLPTRRGVLGVGTCDKGLPAMMMALAAAADLPAVLVPGGVTLMPEAGEDAGMVQTIGARFARGSISLEEAAEAGCRACATPGGGCQFLGTAATAQVIGEALGMSLGHAALAPSGQPIWLEMARRSARALLALEENNLTLRSILTPAAVENALLTFAAIGGSTNFLLHLPAIAHAAGLARPGVGDWERAMRATPRLVDALPNGPRNFSTVQVFLAGGVPEVMLHLRRLGLLRLEALTVAGVTLGEQLDQWAESTRRRALRERLRTVDGVEADDVIVAPAAARARGMAATLCFPRGNLAPEGAVVKSTAIAAAELDADGVYRHTGPARVFTTEAAAIAAIKAGAIRAGDVVALIGRGPLGAGMEETYQLTSALRHLDFGGRVALVTDARFSGVSTGACIGHISPEALAGGPLGKLRDGDRIRIVIDRERGAATLDVVGEDGGAASGAAMLDARAPHPELRPDPAMPAATRLWAALQAASGGVWGGCVYDPEAIVRRLARGREGEPGAS